MVMSYDIVIVNAENTIKHFLREFSIEYTLYNECCRGCEVLSDFDSAGSVHLPIAENNHKISRREN